MLAHRHVLAQGWWCGAEEMVWNACGTTQCFLLYVALFVQYGEHRAATPWFLVEQLLSMLSF